MGVSSLTHWLILLVVVVVIFGTSKLKNAGKDLGSAVKGFKDAVKDKDKPKLSQHDSEVVKAEEVTLDGSQTKKDETV